MADLGQLKRLDPRTAWPHEAQDFTPWLAAHLEHLAEVLEMDLELVQTEASVGDFSIDILAKDLGRDRAVIIESQLKPTDHDHLGKLITYAAGKDAGAVVWISREVRDEHRQALDWLNRGHGGSTHFFGVVVELLQIDGSRPAVNFRLVAAPIDWSGGLKAATSEPDATGKRAAYQRFFQRLIDALREKHRFTNARASQPQNWYTFTSGHRGFVYGVSFAHGGKLRAELYIDGGDEDENERAFESLRAVQADIEREFAEPLEWEDLPDKQACRIAIYRSGSIEDSQESIDEYFAWSVERMLRFKRVFDPRLARVERMGGNRS